MANNNTIKSIREIYKGRMTVAREDSAKLSILARYLALAGCGIIWLLLTPHKSLTDLPRDTTLWYSSLLFVLTIILEILHLGISVSVNLYYAKFRLFKYPSYIPKSDRSTRNRIPTTFPKFALIFQWVLWYIKFLTLLMGYVLILFKLA